MAAGRAYKELASQMMNIRARARALINVELVGELVGERARARISLARFNFSRDKFHLILIVGHAAPLNLDFSTFQLAANKCYGPARARLIKMSLANGD